MSKREPPNILVRISEDGEEYRVVETPATVVLPEVEYGGGCKTTDGYVFHHLFVKCKMIREMGLPLDANPREPTRVKVVDEMATTLRETPEMFHHWNNGATMVCDSFRVDGNVATIEFGQGTGVCNGGHTYFSIVTYPEELPDNALLHLEVIDVPELEEEARRLAINSIARNRNANRQLLPTTQADFLEYYEPFKAAMADEVGRVRWHEGDSSADEDAIGSELLVRMLASIDPFWYHHAVHSAEKKNHKGAATGSRSIHNRWFDGQNDSQTNLQHIAPLVMSAFRIVEIVSYSLLNDDLKEVSVGWRNTKLYQWLHEGEHTTKDHRKGELALSLPNPAIVMFLGFFRGNVWLANDEDGNPAFVGMLADPEQLWNEAKTDVLRRLTESFNDSGQDPNQFIKSDSPYGIQLTSIVYGRHVPTHPIWFYRLSDHCRFLHTTDNPTHVLRYDPEGYADLVPRNGEPVPSEEMLFRAQ